MPARSAKTTTRQREREAVVWVLDTGAEQLLPVSVCSLRLSAEHVWRRYMKVILDLGLSPTLRAWLDDQSRDGVHRVEIERPAASSVVGGLPHGPAQAMCARVRLASTLADLSNDGALPPVGSFIHVDPDTVFFGSPAPALARPWAGEHIRVAREWDWQGDPSRNCQVTLKLDRSSTFNTPTDDRVARLAKHLGFGGGELQTLETYNSGVWVARPGRTLTLAWERAYERLREIDALEGGRFLNPHSSEQNGLTVAIHRGEILCRPLPRAFNQFPPRPPHSWPPNTCIAHFITFGRNGTEERYRRWFQWRDAIVSAGLCPADLVQVTLPERIEPQPSAR